MVCMVSVMFDSAHVVCVGLRVTCENDTINCLKSIKGDLCTAELLK